MTRLLLALIAVDAILANGYGLLNINVWDAHTTSLLVRASMWSAFICWMIPYKYLQAKTIAAIFFLTQFCDVIQYYIPESSVPMMVGISVGIFVPWLLYALFRRYSLQSDVLTDEYVYIIAKRPNSIISFIASIYGQPFGRYAYYIGGSVFHYHHSVFKMTTADLYPMEESTIIRTSIKADSYAKEGLVKMLGKKWSLWNNCLTVRVHNA